MGKTNFLSALENKLGHLLGEVAADREAAIKIENMARTLPVRMDRIAKLEKVIEAVELVITHYHPEWQRDTIDPVRPHVHQLPTRLGEAARKALDVLREATVPMTARDIAREIIRREELPDVNQATLDKLANSTQANLKRYMGKGMLENDGAWPAKWWVMR